jgi:hypothetical protein
MEDQRTYGFCKELTGSFYYRFSLKKATKITLFEKFCLWFIQPQYTHDDPWGTILVWKKFRGKTYILNHFIAPPKHYNCRHELNPVKQPLYNTPHL